MSDDPKPGPSSAIPSEASIRIDVSVAGLDSLKTESRYIIEEQPLRIIIGGEPVATLMRTPGSEVELALGFLMTEGIVKSRKDIAGIMFCRDGSWAEPGEIHVRLASAAGSAEGSQEKTRGYRDVLSSCSLCGDEWMQLFAEGIPPFHKPARRLRIEDIIRLKTIMSETQPLFVQTGATHAAAIYEIASHAAPYYAATDESRYSLLFPLQRANRTGLPGIPATAKEGAESAMGQYVVREDLGRHNALDKAVGAALGVGISLDKSLLLLSSRLSFEMVAKAARAGISDVAGVSAPSAPAIRLARHLGMFLAGFVRGETMTVYSGVEALDRAMPNEV